MSSMKMIITLLILTLGVGLSYGAPENGPPTKVKPDMGIVLGDATAVAVDYIYAELNQREHTSKYKIYIAKEETTDFKPVMDAEVFETSLLYPPGYSKARWCTYNIIKTTEEIKMPSYNRVTLPERQIRDKLSCS
jgi:hypothetical protein